MKTAMIARFVMGAAAIFAAAGLAGCGAETGAPEGAIGSTSEALSVQKTGTLPADFGALAGSPAAREFSAHCLINDGGTIKKLIVGGFDSTGAGKLDAYLYTPGTPGSTTGTWVAKASLPNGESRGAAQLIQNPQDNTQCILVGGTANKYVGSAVTERTTTYVYDVDTNLWTAAGTINARTEFGLAKCGTGANATLIAIGGRNGSGAATNSIQVWNMSNAWSTLQDGSAHDLNLTSARYGFAFAPKDAQNFFIHSGSTSSAIVPSIELINVNTSCAGATRNRVLLSDLGWDDDSNVNTPDVIGQGRLGPVAFLEGSTAGRFVVTSGDTRAVSGTPFPLDAEEFTVTSFTTPTISMNQIRSSQLTVGVRFASLSAAGGTKYMLVGGENRTTGTFVDSLRATPVNNVQEYNSSGSWSFDTLTTARLGSAPEYVNSAVFTTAGKVDTSGPTWTTTTEAITP